MAKQKGTIKLNGTMDDLTFYKMNGEFYVRRKSSLNKKRVKKDNAFKNSREASNEFGASAKLAGIFRKEIMPFLLKDKQPYLNGKLTAVFQKMIQRGSGIKGRRIPVWLNETENFVPINLNNAEHPHTYVSNQPVFSRQSVTLQIEVPELSLLKHPTGASHYQIIYLIVRKPVIAIENENYIFSLDTNKINPINGPITPIGNQYSANMSVVLNQNHNYAICWGIQFYEKINNDMYELNTLPLAWSQII